MGNETKLGLLVGVLFIILFGVILGGRVGTASDDHAPLPVGHDHGVIAKSITEPVDPFDLDVSGPPAAPPVRPAAGDAPPPAAEEVSSPADEATDETADEPADEPEAPVPPPTGRLAFGPVNVETPMPPTAEGAHGPSEAEPAADEPEPAADGRPQPAPPVSLDRPMHIVRAGETLTAIACQHYGADGRRLWRRIWEANKADLPDPDRLRQGQKLVIPGLPTDLGPARTESRVADASDRGGDAPSVELEELQRRIHTHLRMTGQPPTYTVQKGDTFYSIARNLYGDPAMAKELMRANRDRVPDVHKLRVGQEILLPETGEVASASGAGDPSAVAQR